MFYFSISNKNRESKKWDYFIAHLHTCNDQICLAVLLLRNIQGFDKAAMLYRDYSLPVISHSRPLWCSGLTIFLLLLPQCSLSFRCKNCAVDESVAAMHPMISGSKREISGLHSRKRTTGNQWLLRERELLFPRDEPNTSTIFSNCCNIVINALWY